MAKHTKIQETVKMNGNCHFLNQDLNILVTYEKLNMLGDPSSYAIIKSIDCPHIEECPDCPECPIALQRTYW